VLISGIGSYVYENADFGVAGRVLGEVPLGSYTVAWTIASAPVEKIANLVTGVTPAFFSAVQASKDELRRYFLRLTEVLSLVTVPASIGLALTANDLVPVLLGPKWHAAVGPLRLLGIFIAVRSVSTVLPHLLNAIGDARFVMWSTIASDLVMPLAFLVGSHWGTDGIAAAWVIAYPPAMMPLYWRVFQKTDTRIKDYALTVFPAVTSSLVMAVAVTLVHLESPLRPYSMPELCLLVFAGALSYGGALLLFHYGRVLRMLRALKRVHNAGTDAEQPAAVSL
jgi:O-antigen/teichoic acid export membrane protein